MAETTDDGGPAFPLTEDAVNYKNRDFQMQGMSLRQYAAIHLRVPDSGDLWLDDMIRWSLRNEFAGRAMANSYTHSSCAEEAAESANHLALLLSGKRLMLELGIEK